MFAQAANRRPIEGAVATLGVSDRVVFLRKTYAHLGVALLGFALLTGMIMRFASETSLKASLWALHGHDRAEREQCDCEISKRVRRKKIAADSRHGADSGPTDGVRNRLQEAELGMGLELGHRHGGAQSCFASFHLNQVELEAFRQDEPADGAVAIVHIANRDCPTADETSSAI